MAVYWEHTDALLAYMKVHEVVARPDDADQFGTPLEISLDSSEKFVPTTDAMHLLIQQMLWSG